MKVDGQFLHARWWLQSPMINAHTLLHFGQTKIWAEDDLDAALSASCVFYLRLHASLS